MARIDELFENLGMVEIMDCIVLQGYNAGQYLKIKPNRVMIHRGLTEDERLQVETWVNDDYAEWYRLWQAVENRTQLQIQVVEIGAYYQRYIQSLFGMTPDLLRDDVHQLFGKVAGLVLKTVGSRLKIKDYFKLTLIKNTVLPDSLKDWFKQGLYLGITHASYDYDDAIRNFKECKKIDYMRLSIFGFMERLKLEGIKDPLWFEEFFNSPTFTYRTLDAKVSRRVILDIIGRQGKDSKEIRRRNQLLEDALLLSGKNPMFSQVKPEIVGEDTIRWRVVKDGGYILTTFGKQYIIGYELNGVRDVVIATPNYSLTMQEYGKAVRNLYTKFQVGAPLVAILIENSRLKN